MTTNKQKIFFRADGNSNIGMGHLVRSLALADMLKHDFECIFLSRCLIPNFKNEADRVCSQVVDLDVIVDKEDEAQYLVKNLISEKDILVLDGYQFESNYQKAVYNNIKALVSIDDIHSCYFYSDVIINHSGHATKSHYKNEDYAKLYLGPKYAIVRKPFREAQLLNKIVPDFNYKNIFLCLGGADPNNTTLEVINFIEQFDNINSINVVIGPAFKFKLELENYKKVTQAQLNIFSNLSSNEMVILMQKCNIAITSASTVSFEYLSVGGCLFLKKIAENQNEIYQYFVDNGLAFEIFDFSKINTFEIKASLNRQKVLFDGKAENRFKSIFKNLSFRE